MCLSSGLSDYVIKSQEVSGVGSVREYNYWECTDARDGVADGNMADTLQAEQKGVRVISDASRLPIRYSCHMICSYSFSPLKIGRVLASAHRSEAVSWSCQPTKESQT